MNKENLPIRFINLHKKRRLQKKMLLFQLLLNSKTKIWFQIKHMINGEKHWHLNILHCIVLEKNDMLEIKRISRYIEMINE